MTDTRNKSQRGNYELEQKGNMLYYDYLGNRENHYGEATTTYFAGNGLLSGRVASIGLANNACDIESMLRGIGSCNLVSAQSAPTPDIRHLKSLDIIETQAVILPNPLIVQKDQRPQFR